MGPPMKTLWKPQLVQNVDAHSDWSKQNRPCHAHFMFFYAPIKVLFTIYRDLIWIEVPEGMSSPLCPCTTRKISWEWPSPGSISG